MSVEALLSEVTSTIVYAPIIAAAESHFYHDSRVLSDIKPETSHAGGHGGHHNHHGHAHGNQKGDKVANAIHEMKDAIHKAKKGGGRNRHGSQKSESNGDLSKLTQELEELKLGYQTLKNEVESLRKLVQSTHLIEQFLRIGNQILVLGDGNLSFSLALASLLPELQVTATVLESESDFYRNYPTGISHVFELKKLSNVNIVFGVDARALPINWKGHFTDIIMNFPHHGGKTNIRKSKQLMNEIFASIYNFIVGTDTKFHLTLMSLQAGFDFVQDDLLYEPPNHRKDSWNILYLAANSELMVQHVDEFLLDLFPRYISSGYNNRDISFHNHNQPIKMVFVPNPLYSNFINIPSLCNQLFHPYRPFYYHDISILFCNSLSDEPVFLRFLSEISAGVVVKFYTIDNLDCICPKTLLFNRIYRLIWQPQVFAIGKQKCNSFQEQLRSKLVSAFADRFCRSFVLT